MTRTLGMASTLSTVTQSGGRGWIKSRSAETGTTFKRHKYDSDRPIMNLTRVGCYIMTTFYLILISRARNKLIFASVLCLVFMIAEVVGGVLSNSLAIATDAAHLLTDFASFMISLFAIWVAGRPSSERMSFGWHRAEVLGAIVSVLLIWVVTGVLVYMAVLRVVNMEFEIDAKVMLITSGLGVLVNIIMGASLHQHGHAHGGGGGEAEHGHGHSHGGGEENINVKAAFIHVVGDFLQSLGETKRVF